jgi:hypothetical protein
MHLIYPRFYSSSKSLVITKILLKFSPEITNAENEQMINIRPMLFIDYQK